MKTSQSIGQLAKALSLAQGKFPKIKRDSSVSQKGVTRAGKEYEIKYEYAPLESIISSCKVALSENELSFSQSFMFYPEYAVVETLLMHSSGEWIITEFPVLLNEANKMQLIGAAATYARRYALIETIGVQPDDEDDDAQNEEFIQNKSTFKQSPKKELSKSVAPPPSNKITEAQAKELYNLGINGGYTAQEMISALKATVGVDKWNSVPASEYERLKGLFSISNKKG